MSNNTNPPTAPKKDSQKVVFLQPDHKTKKDRVIDQPASTTHHLPAGAVSFGLLWDILLEYEDFTRRMEYIIDTVPGEHYQESHFFLSNLIKDMSQALDPYFDKAREEKEILGDNNVYVVKEGTS